MRFAILLLIMLKGFLMSAEKIELATLGGGCFWCLEAIYDDVKGVKSAKSGYAGGEMVNPDYKSVTTGKTGHAEVMQITYDASAISYEEILNIFWQIHDPTTLNRQGNDTGTQYRSVILYHDESQKKIAEESLKKAQSHFKDKIVTQIVPLEKFYEAEEYHQNYYKQNPDQGYCQFVIAPKVKKFEKDFGKYLK